MQSEITRIALTAGEVKAAKATPTLLAQAVMAGAFISLGGLLSILVGYGFPEAAAVNPGLQRLLSGLTFPVGLFLIVMLGGELFTGNNAVLIPGLAHGRFRTGALLRNWALVWLGNLAGALAFTFLFVLAAGITDIYPYREAMQGIALAKCSLPPVQILMRAIAANWCVCLAVWLAIYVKGIGAKALACWIPVAAFVICGYEHSIANMFFIPCGALAGAPVEWGAACANILLATLGNIIGGALLVGLLFTRMYRADK